MEISRLYLPLEEMKTQLKDMSDTELSEYISSLSEARRRGPATVPRSHTTGAPRKGKSTSPMSKLDALLSQMSDVEKEAFLASIEEE